MRLTTPLIPLISLVCANCALAEDPVPPPGLVFIEGGNTKIGADWKELEPTVLERPEVISPLSAQIPQHNVTVPDFFLMVTEVTHEQYAAYVRETGAKPPIAWADEEALTAVQLAFIAQDGEMRKEIRDRGETPPPAKKFEREDWWKNNWQENNWSVPAELSSMPITNVNYQEATGYARWAGLRLMDETEYQRAVRGDEDWLYPWGEEWDRDACAHSENSKTSAWPVGSFPKGATKEGVYDLIGNVWEWTSTPFEAYPKWKVPTVVIKEGKTKRKVDGVVPWQSDHRVVVSGNFQNNSLANRCTTRRGTDRYQSTDGFGFRCAASIEPGEDVSKTVLRDDLPVELRPAGSEYLTDKVTALDRWVSNKGSAQTKVTVEEQGKDKGEGEPKAKTIDLPNYAVINSYDYVMFVPTDKPDAGSTVKGMRTKSLENGPIHLGFLSTTKPTLVPELPIGTYRIAFRAAGEDPVIEPDEADADEPIEASAPAVEYPEGTDLLVDNLLFYDAESKVTAAIANFTIIYGKGKDGAVTIRDATRPIPGKDKKGEDIILQDPVDETLFQVSVPAAGNRKGWELNFPLQFTKGTFEGSWRH